MAANKTYYGEVNPCVRDCPDRTARCHTNCEMYRAFAEECKKRRDAEFAKNSEKAEMRRYKTEKVYKANKKKRHRANNK